MICLQTSVFIAIITNLMMIICLCIHWRTIQDHHYQSSETLWSSLCQRNELEFWWCFVVVVWLYVWFFVLFSVCVFCGFFWGEWGRYHGIWYNGIWYNYISVQKTSFKTKHCSSFNLWKDSANITKSVNYISWVIAWFSKLSQRNSLKDHVDDYKYWR